MPRADRPALLRDEAAALALLRLHATDAVAFQSLESGMRWWRDEGAPGGSGAALAYVDAGRSRIAVGTPLAPASARATAIGRFVRDARSAGRRAVFFGVEALAPFDGLRRLSVGLQSELRPAQWPATLRGSGKLREQLRRARAKGVTVRRVPASDVAPGTSLRLAVDALRDEWLGHRPMDPMSFLVAVEPFQAPAEHLYIAAEHANRIVLFMSAVPIYARGGWLIEDVLRSGRAPNGTTELAIDCVMRALTGDGEPAAGEPWITPGLTPLAGDVVWWMRLASAMTVALYDFDGLRRFRARLSPLRWTPVWLVWDRGAAPVVLLDVLRAFAGGSVVAFAVRTLVSHPNGPPWVVAVPLVGWTLLLAVLAASGHSSVLGFATATLWGWVVFDTLLAWQLFRAARRPRARSLAILAALASLDAVLSVRHLASEGLDGSWLTAGLRLLATVGPILGAISLGWATSRAIVVRRERKPALP